MVQVKYPAVTDASSNPLVLTYGTGGTYGGFDLPTWLAPVRQAGRFAHGPAVLCGDRNSNRLYRKNEHPDATSFDELYHDNAANTHQAYDGLNRLKAFRRGAITGNDPGSVSDGDDLRRRQVFTLDQLGNWTAFDLNEDGDATTDLEQTRTHNGVNEITAIGQGGAQPVWIDPVHDLAGNMRTGPKAGSGTSTDTEQTRLHFVYDAWNRLTQVWEDDGETTTFDPAEDTRVAEHQYDGLHRRTVKLVYDSGNDDWDRTDYYYTTAWQVIEERFAADVAPANKGNVATAVKVQYLWDIRYIDAAVVRWRDDNDDTDFADDGEELYYTNDANMNVTALVEADGDVAERYVYDPYGKPTIYDDDWSDTLAWSAGKKNEVLYCGYRYDPESGLYHVRYRYLHSTLGRWMQRDPLGYTDQMALYEYVASLPGAMVDPLGLEGEKGQPCYRQGDRLVKITDMGTAAEFTLLLETLYTTHKSSVYFGTMDAFKDILAGWVKKLPKKGALHLVEKTIGSGATKTISLAIKVECMGITIALATRMMSASTELELEGVRYEVSECEPVCKTQWRFFLHIIPYPVRVPTGKFEWSGWRRRKADVTLELAKKPFHLEDHLGGRGADYGRQIGIEDFWYVARTLAALSKETMDVLGDADSVKARVAEKVATEAQGRLVE